MKAVIAASEFTIASRYHSLVAALSARTPVAVLGWSHKYDELMDDMGLANYNVNLMATVPSATDVEDMILRAYRDRELLKHQIAREVPAVEREVERMFTEVGLRIEGGTARPSRAVDKA